MDPALLKEQELFKKRALALPVVEKKKKKESESSSFKDDKKKSRMFSSPSIGSSTSSAMSYKSASFTNNSSFINSIKFKIIKFMKDRYLDGDDYPLSLNEILEESNQLHLTSNTRALLEADLPSNEKLEQTPDGKFTFKPKLKIKDKKSFLRLLKHYDLKGLGGIELDDVQESLPNFERAMKALHNEIIIITRSDKKKIIFYNDRSAKLDIDEEFQKLWRSVPVESMDVEKIEEYLEKHGIKSMQDHGIKKKIIPLKRKRAVNRKNHLKKPRENEHIAEDLEHYDE